MQDRMLIGGAWCGAASGKTFPVRNPATDALIAEVPDGTSTDTAQAISAAAAAFPAWSATTALERSGLLRALAAAMMQRQEQLATLCTSECGKPLTEARGEVAYAAGFLDWFAEEARRVYGQSIPSSDPAKRLLTLRRPVGVAAAITPWNFPLAMVTRKMGPALAAGCTQVVKPAEQTPLSALAIAELAAEVGFPAGVINVVTGLDAAALCAPFFQGMTVRHVSFTGSTEVGKLLIRQSADSVIRLSLELGGHAPFVVFEDADLDLAVAGAMASKFRNSGQTCVCANRFLVQRSVRAAFVEKFTAAVRALKVGRGDQPGVNVGPLIDDAGDRKVAEHVQEAVAAGAAIRCGGKPARVEGGSARFFEPTVLDQVTPAMRCAREETFGPVAPVMEFGTEQEALAMANDTPYGLAAYCYTRDGARIVRMMEGLHYGIVGINDALPACPQAPFGGVKQSGLGREGGPHGIDEYLDLRYVSWRVG
ncbi:MAG: NAD-dependent succinate-semialdehyde dehydrogenase [Phycisphaerales bacterium]